VQTERNTKLIWIIFYFRGILCRYLGGYFSLFSPFRRICNSAAMSSEFQIRFSILSNCKFARTSRTTAMHPPTMPK